MENEVPFISFLGELWLDGWASFVPDIRLLR